MITHGDTLKVLEYIVHKFRRFIQLRTHGHRVNHKNQKHREFRPKKVVSLVTCRFICSSVLVSSLSSASCIKTTTKHKWSDFTTTCFLRKYLQMHNGALVFFHLTVLTWMRYNLGENNERILQRAVPIRKITNWIKVERKMRVCWQKLHVNWFEWKDELN